MIAVLSALCMIAGSAAAGIPVYAEEMSEVPASQEENVTEYAENSSQAAQEEDKKEAAAGQNETEAATIYTSNGTASISSGSQESGQTVSGDVPMQVASSEEFVISGGTMAGKLMAKKTRAAANNIAARNFTTAVQPGENPVIYGDGILVADSSSGDYINTSVKPASSQAPPSTVSSSEQTPSESVSSEKKTSPSGSSQKSYNSSKTSGRKSGKTVSQGKVSSGSTVQDENYADTDTATEDQTQEEEIAPKTGDTMNFAGYLLVFAASGFILAAVCIGRRKGNR